MLLIFEIFPPRMLIRPRTSTRHAKVKKISSTGCHKNMLLLQHQLGRSCHFSALECLVSYKTNKQKKHLLKKEFFLFSRYSHPIYKINDFTGRCT